MESLFLVGSVPTCAVAAELFLEKNNHHTVGKEVEQPIAGVIIHAGLYSGQSYPCGCLIHCCDPLNNAKNVADIQVGYFTTYLFYNWSLLFRAISQFHLNNPQ